MNAPATGPLAGIVLAAGTSSRFGDGNKLLAPFKGEPMVKAVVQSAIASSVLEPVVVVTGHEQSEVAAALEGLNVQLVHNPDFAEGQSTSLKCGLAAVPKACAGAMVLLGDMPDISPSLIAQIAAAFTSSDDIVVPYADGRRGNPVVMGRAHFSALRKLKGDSGARALLCGPQVRRVELGDTSVLRDYDTPDSLGG